MVAPVGPSWVIKGVFLEGHFFSKDFMGTEFRKGIISKKKAQPPVSGGKKGPKGQFFGFSFGVLAWDIFIQKKPRVLPDEDLKKSYFVGNLVKYFIGVFFVFMAKFIVKKGGAQVPGERVGKNFLMIF